MPVGAIAHLSHLPVAVAMAVALVLAISNTNALTKPYHPLAIVFHHLEHIFMPVHPAPNAPHPVPHTRRLPLQKP
jgi:hypothetical protein